MQRCKKAIDQDTDGSQNLEFEEKGFVIKCCLKDIGPIKAN